MPTEVKGKEQEANIKALLEENYNETVEKPDESTQPLNVVDVDEPAPPKPDKSKTIETSDVKEETPKAKVEKLKFKDLVIDGVDFNETEFTSEEVNKYLGLGITSERQLRKAQKMLSEATALIEKTKQSGLKPEQTDKKVEKIEESIAEISKEDWELLDSTTKKILESIIGKTSKALAELKAENNVLKNRHNDEDGTSKWNEEREDFLSRNFEKVDSDKRKPIKERMSPGDFKVFQQAVIFSMDEGMSLENAFFVLQGKATFVKNKMSNMPQTIVIDKDKESAENRLGNTGGIGGKPDSGPKPLRKTLEQEAEGMFDD